MGRFSAVHTLPLDADLPHHCSTVYPATGPPFRRSTSTASLSAAATFSFRCTRRVSVQVSFAPTGRQTSGCTFLTFPVAPTRSGEMGDVIAAAEKAGARAAGGESK